MNPPREAVIKMSAAREEIPVLSIHLNNYEMAGYDTPFFGEWAEVAEGLNCYGERVTEPAELGAAIERAIEKTEEGTPALLEIITAKETELSRPDLE